jgi:CheY-like chemotaxis protein
MAKILLVEDEKPLNEAYALILKSNGHDVASAYDGAEALKTLSDWEPDVILLDLVMPKMSGIEFLKKYNPKKNHPKVKIIVFSNIDSDKEIDKAYALGAQKYILKIWASPQRLNELVRDTLTE